MSYPGIALVRRELYHLSVFEERDVVRLCTPCIIHRRFGVSRTNTILDAWWRTSAFKKDIIRHGLVGEDLTKVFSRSFRSIVLDLVFYFHWSAPKQHPIHPRYNYNLTKYMELLAAVVSSQRIKFYVDIYAVQAIGEKLARIHSCSTSIIKIAIGWNFIDKEDAAFELRMEIPDDWLVEALEN